MVEPMYLTEDEAEQLVRDGNAVLQRSLGTSRWTETVETTVLADDGKYYRIMWAEGLTEMQEDEFYSGEVPEVFPLDSLEVRSKVLYLTAEEQAKLRPTLADKLMAEADSYAIATGKSPKSVISKDVYEAAAELRERLFELRTLDLMADSDSYRKATEQYLDGIIALWEME